MAVIGSKYGGYAPHFGSKVSSTKLVMGQKNHGMGMGGGRSGIRSLPSTRGIGDTGTGPKAAGNTPNPVGNGQRDGQVRDYKLNSSVGSKVEKRKRGADV